MGCSLRAKGSSGAGEHHGMLPLSDGGPRPDGPNADIRVTLVP